MDWSNESYVRLYTRDTDDDLVLSWEARAVWHEMLKKFDRSGLLSLRRGRRGLAAVLRLPVDVVESAIPELVEDGRVVELELGYFAPNFLEAQEAPSSDPHRKRESRARRRDIAAAEAAGLPVTKRGAEVTKRDGTRHSVTKSDADVTNRDEMSGDPGLRSLLPDPDLSSQTSRARTIPPSTEHVPPGQPPKITTASDPRSRRQIERARLFDRAWQFAAVEHRKLKDGGVDAHARNCWSGTPHGEAKDLLFARIDELTEGDAPDWDHAWSVIENRVLVAAAEARHKLKHLSFFTPVRVWDGKSFGIASDLSPQQVERDARRAPSSASAHAPTMRMAARDDDAPPPLMPVAGGKS